MNRATPGSRAVAALAAFGLFAQTVAPARLAAVQTAAKPPAPATAASAHNRHATGRQPRQGNVASPMRDRRHRRET